MTRRLALALAGTALLAAPAAATAAPKLYVSLGDSYTSAPLVPINGGEPAGCLRSDHNYPSLVAQALSAGALRDASCSGAETVDMTGSQQVNGGANTPQFDRLSKDADLVTVGIGGNDVGLVGAATTCARLGATDPFGTACRSHYTASGTDELATRIRATGSKIAAVITGIHDRAPAARVVVVGYPDVLPQSGNCYPLVPLSADDVRYFDGLIRQTNQMLSEQAAAGDAEYANTYDDSIGHDVCTLPPNRWYEGLVPTAPAYPLHPNAMGEASMARSVVKVLAQPAPVPHISGVQRSATRLRPGRGVRLQVTLDRPATVRVGVRRSGARGEQAFSVVLAAGTQKVTLGPKRLGRRAGRYRITLTPSGRLRTGTAVTTAIRVVRARR